jgi:hypothetical protein
MYHSRLSGVKRCRLSLPAAERLGYPADVLDRIPARAVESFAGVGYFFDSPGRARASPSSTSA